MVSSRQGINVAFIGTDEYAQTACAEYLKRKLNFKRMDLEDGLIHFLRTTYGYHQRFKLRRSEIRQFYDELYKIDNDIWIGQFTRKFLKSENDIVVSDIRYLHELDALRDLGFVVCRVTSEPRHKKDIGRFIKHADKGTVALAMLYDKTFAHMHNVDFSIHFTNHANLPAIIHPFLEQNGYKFDT